MRYKNDLRTEFLNRWLSLNMNMQKSDEYFYKNVKNELIK